MICPDCKKENKDTNIRCEFCGTQLIDIDEVSHPYGINPNVNDLERKELNLSTKKVGCISDIVIFIFVGPWLLIGIAFFGFGLFSGISEHTQIRQYEETIGILKDYTNCNYETGSELCEAIYEYEVNGVTYLASSDDLSAREDFKENEKVYYNPKNPSEYAMHTGWSSLIITGAIILAVVIPIFVIKNKIINNISNGKEKITMNVYKRK